MLQPSILDLVFVTPRIYPFIIDWGIPEHLQTGLDHELIRFSVLTNTSELVENPLTQNLYNLEKADWTRFATTLKTIGKAVTNSVNSANLAEPLSLDSIAEKLQSAINQAAEQHIPKLRITAKSKPWWSEKIDHLRKEMSHFKRQWKRGNRAYEDFAKARTEYFKEIRTAKANHWNEFLEKA